MWSLQDAKNKFSSVVQAAMNSEPQHVSKFGQPAVVVLSAIDYDRLIKLDKEQSKSLPSMLLGMPQDDISFENSNVEPREFVL